MEPLNVCLQLPPTNWEQWTAILGLLAWGIGWFTKTGSDNKVVKAIQFVAHGPKDGILGVVRGLFGATKKK